jgi:hypothetical protein
VIRPDLVPATIRKAPSITGKDYPDIHTHRTLAGLAGIL